MKPQKKLISSFLFALCSSIALAVCLLAPSIKAHAQTEIQPKPLHQPAPAYPAALAREGVEGRVDFTFAVKADGSVTEVKIFESPDPRMSRAAEKAVLTWKYEPFDMPHGQNVVWLKASLGFDLKN